MISSLFCNKEKIVLVVHPNAGNAIVINDYEYNEFLDIANEWFLKIEDYKITNLQSLIVLINDLIDKAPPPKKIKKKLITIIFYLNLIMLTKKE